MNKWGDTFKNKVGNTVIYVCLICYKRCYSFKHWYPEMFLLTFLEWFLMWLIFITFLVYCYFAISRLLYEIPSMTADHSDLKIHSMLLKFHYELNFILSASFILKICHFLLFVWMLNSLPSFMNIKISCYICLYVYEDSYVFYGI